MICGMPVGMPTLIKLENIEENARLCKSLNLDFVELNMNLPEFQTDKIDISHLLSLKEKLGLFFTIHLDENLNVCDFNARVSDAYLQTVVDTIAVAKAISAPVINMHLSKGIYFTLPNRKEYLYNRYSRFYYEKLVAFRKICEKEIGNSDIKICIENTNGYEEFSRQGIQLLLKSKAFGLTLDVGHCFCAKETDMPFINSNSDRLNHIHLHDAKGSDCHLALQDGEIDIAAKIALAKEHNCRIVLETKTVESLTKSVSLLNDYELE